MSSSFPRSLPMRSSPDPKLPTHATTMDMLQQTTSSFQDMMAGQWSSQEYGRFPPPSNGRSKSSSKSPTGAKNFVFVTVTEPEQFHSKETMRDVRSNVMYEVIRRRQEEQKPKSRSRRNTEQQPANPSTIENQTALEIYRKEPKRTKTLDSSIADSTPESCTAAGSPENLTRLPPKRQRTTSSSTYSPSSPSQILVQPPIGSPHCAGMNEHFYLAYPTLGPVSFFSPYDPFYTLPKPANAAIDVERMKWHCHHYFGTRAMAYRWLPQAIQAREAFLSTLCISSTHEDAMVGVQSHVTIIVHTEVMHIIQEQLKERWSRIKDSTIMSVAHLLCSRLVSSNEAELAAHEDGLRRLIEERGGMEKLGIGGELAAVSTAMVLTSSLLRESTPHPIFLTYASTLQTQTPSPTAVIPESPIYCPRARFYTLEQSKTASPALLELVYSMRTLTDLCLSTSTTSSSSAAEKTRIRDAVRATPSQVHALSKTADARAWKQAWRAEAVRLASLLWAEAVVNKTALSSVAGLTDPATTAGETAGGMQGQETVLSALHTALRNSGAEYSDCWGDLTGALFWVTLVAGVVGRASSSSSSSSSSTSSSSSSPSSSSFPFPRSPTTKSNGDGSETATAHAAAWMEPETERRARRDRERERQRKWCVALHVRCAIVLAFEHRAAVVGALSTMLGVVRALGGR